MQVVKQHLLERHSLIKTPLTMIQTQWLNQRLESRRGQAAEGSTHTQNKPTCSNSLKSDRKEK